MAPPPAVSFMAGMACREAMNMLSTLTCMTRRQSCGAISTTLPRPPIPTLLSRQSSRPNRDGGFDHGAGLLLVGHVGHVGRRDPAFIRDHRDGAFGPFAIEIDDQHLGA